MERADEGSWYVRNTQFSPSMTEENRRKQHAKPPRAKIVGHRHGESVPRPTKIADSDESI